MATNRRRLGARLTRFGLNLSGFVLLLSLPGLWVAWSPAVLWTVTGLGVAAGWLHCALLWLEPAPTDDSPPGRAAPRLRPERNPEPAPAAHSRAA